ncbi:MAG: ATP-binding cassette domain-containing protein, partial [Alphaproteobacteria bacterium]|nr:ATP-binding cassette domain-containing protein [Alphaproteobacteria bacterium]
MTSEHEPRQADTVLRAAWGACSTALLATAGFSLCVNLLMLAGPLYMLQIYDRVLVSRSVPTLAVLSAILVLLFFAMGILEAVRTRLMNRVAGRLNGILGPSLLDTVLSTGAMRHADGQTALRDLGTVRKFLSSPGPMAFFDMPWVPVYLGIVFLMHWGLGLVALAGALVMLTLAVATDRSTRRQITAATDVGTHGQRMISEAMRSIEAILSMGMKSAVARRWVRVHDFGEIAQRSAADRIGGFSAATSTLRLMLQSALLGLGAFLAIDDIISPGMMIAASIITGRALAPISQTVSNFRGLQDALGAHKKLRRVLESQPPQGAAMAVPRPAGRLEAAEIYAAPPGVSKPVLQGVRFALEPGEALGIIGPSASGKSTLARVLVGLWPTKRGTVRLGGSDIAHWDGTQRGSWMGYLPQDVDLMDGTVQE